MNIRSLYFTLALAGCAGVQPIAPPAGNQSNACIPPAYPAESEAARESGTVLLALYVSADGKVLETQVKESSGYPRLDQAAAQGLSACRFVPATQDGHPVAAWTTFKYTWRMAGDPRVTK